MADERHRSPITRKGYRKGKPARNKGRKLPAEVLTADELERVMATFDRSTKRGVRNAAMAALMARAGLKVGQVLAMQRWHYEYGAHVITVPIGSGKSVREETIPIDAVTRELLEAWWAVRKQLNMSRMAPLFAGVNEGSVGNPVHPAYIRTKLREAADLADIDKRVTPSGLKATYEARTAERSQRMVAQFAAYIDEATFGNRYPIAYERWRDAFDLLEIDPERHATRIGHDCRDAINAFAAALAQRHGLTIEPAANVSVKTVRTALDADRATGEKVREFLKALIHYWGTLTDLALRQDHSGERPKGPLGVEDARRLVFQTLVVMTEIDRTMPEGLGDPQQNRPLRNPNG